MSLIDTCFSEEALHESFMEIRNNVKFKYNVQHYRFNELKEIRNFRKAYKDGTFKFSKSKPFLKRERGKQRYIQPVAFRDRVVIHSFIQNILIPKLRPCLIYDNCSSLKGRGIDQQLNRFKIHLKKYFMEHGTNKGYILQTDLTKYYDNIDHEELLLMVYERIPDKEVIDFLALILKEYEVDCSYMSKDEFDESIYEVYNSIEYHKHNYPQLGKQMLRKSVGIGNEVSQICGLFYLHEVDDYVKIVRSQKYYGRYSDDLYLIGSSKKELLDVFKGIKIRARELNLYISEKKTRINKLSRPIIFLKTTFILTNTGKVIMIKNKNNFKRERIKIKKLYKLMCKGEISYKDIENQYSSWRGNIMRKNGKGKNSKRIYKNYKQVDKMDKLYNELFIEPFITGKYKEDEQCIQ